MQQEISIDNRQIISADYDTIESFCRTVICLVILLMMIFVSGYLFIYNALYISISKNIRYYGQLKTIGMTTKQLRRMLRLEGVGYAAISSCISLLIGIPVSYGIYKGMNPYRIPFAVPWLADAVLLMAVFAICMVTPVAIYKRTQGSSLIERLRKEA